MKRNSINDHLQHLNEQKQQFDKSDNPSHLEKSLKHKRKKHLSVGNAPSFSKTTSNAFVDKSMAKTVIAIQEAVRNIEQAEKRAIRNTAKTDQKGVKR